MKQFEFVLLLIVLLSMIGKKASAYDAKIDGVYYNFIGSSAEVTYMDRKDMYNMYGYGHTEYNSDYTGSVIIPESVIYNTPVRDKKF